jgi:ABC-type polysaccharide/polyol phosphate transport system ATPase subunit
MLPQRPSGSAPSAARKSGPFAYPLAPFETVKKRVLAKLEERLGTQLINRNRTGTVSLTPSGEYWFKFSDEVLRKFKSICEFAGIGDYMEQPVKHYSMGMKTRLAFAICAHVDAEILVVDEALAVGDAAFQRKCLDWIDEFRKNGTLLFVSHSTAEVRRLCNRAIWIEGGRIRVEGEPSTVIRAYHRALAMEKDDSHRFSATE